MEHIGVCSSPAIEGNVFMSLRTNEVVCWILKDLKCTMDHPDEQYVKPKGTSDELNKKLDADIN